MTESTPLPPPLHVTAIGSRIEHYGQHGPSCFACKLKTIRFSAFSPPSVSPRDRWSNDPVVRRIEELNNITIDTDNMNRRLRNSGVQTV